jgi:hypothetical protein
MVEREMTLDEIGELIRSIQAAKSESELDAIVTDINGMPDEKRQQVKRAIASTLPGEAQPRRYGEAPSQVSREEVGTPSGNLYYVYSRIVA